MKLKTEYSYVILFAVVLLIGAVAFTITDPRIGTEPPAEASVNGISAFSDLLMQSVSERYQGAELM